MRSALLTLIAMFSLPALAEELPPPVKRAMAEARASCKPDKATIEPGFVNRQEINDDGVPDYILSYEYVTCFDGAHLSCGSAGCFTEVFASTQSGYVKVLGENVQGVSFRKVRGRATMLLGFHGSACGKVGSEPCGATLYWNGSKFSPAH